jgi:hypothetical protein
LVAASQHAAASSAVSAESTFERKFRKAQRKLEQVKEQKAAVQDRLDSRTHEVAAAVKIAEDLKSQLLHISNHSAQMCQRYDSIRAAQQRCDALLTTISNQILIPKESLPVITSGDKVTSATSWAAIQDFLAVFELEREIAAQDALLETEIFTNLLMMTRAVFSHIALEGLDSSERDRIRDTMTRLEEEQHEHDEARLPASEESARKLLTCLEEASVNDESSE